jgi:tRNA pseudouridine38-40 synthase
MFIAFKLAYLGGNNYFGFQKQPNVDTIENVILKSLIKANIGFINDSLEYAGRTDKGVHAWDQTIKIEINSFSLPSRILFRINSQLPKGIFFWAYSEVHKNFSPRFDAILRHYSYIYINDEKNAINLERMKDGAKILIGNHNFYNFSKKDTPNKDSIRIIKNIEIIPLNEISGYLIKISGKSFLWQMVRRITRHLIELGKGETDLNTTLSLLQGKSTKNPEPLPSDGLILEKIEYLETLNWKVEKPILLKIQNEFQKEINNYLQKMAILKYFTQIQSRLTIKHQ